MSLIWNDYGDLSTQFIGTAPIFTSAVTAVSFAVVAGFNLAIVGPQMLVYLGGLIFLFSAIGTAAYLAVKTVEAVIATTEGFAYNYRLHGWVGNGLGLYELVWATWWLLRSFCITWTAYDLASHITEELDMREYAVWHEGTWGHTVDQLDAMKMFTLLIVYAVAIWIAGYSMGSGADELLDFFNHYDSKTDDESSTKQNSTTDPEGTAIIYDLGYHFTTIFGFDLVMIAIHLGGYFFFDKFAKFSEVQACDINDYDSSNYSGIVDSIKGLGAGSYQECMDTMVSLFQKMDLDGNKMVDRCENAKFLKGIGNTDEYASKFSSAQSLPQAQEWCKYVVIDAFDTVDHFEKDQDFLTLIF